MDNVSAEEIRLYGLLDSILDSLDRTALVQIATAHGLDTFLSLVDEASIRDYLFTGLVMRVRPDPDIARQALAMCRALKDAQHSWANEGQFQDEEETQS